MKNPTGTKQELIKEISVLNQKIKELEHSESERKQAEAALQESEEKYRLLFENSPVGIFVYNTQLRFVNCNDRYLTMLRTTRDRIIGLDITTLKDPIAIPVFQLPLEGKCGSYEGSYHTTTSAIDIWISVYTAPLFDGEGRIVGGIGIQEDITDRKQAEQALRESEAKFRTIFESANDAIFLMDQDIIIDCNPKTLEMFGSTREQIIGQPPYRLSPEIQTDGRKSLEKAQEKIKAALRGQPQFFEWKHSRYDGTLFDAEVSLNIFSTGGKYYLQAIVRDITARKQAEEALRISQEQLRDAHRLAHIGVWDWIADIDTVTWTEELYHIAGIDPILPAPTYAEHSNIYTPESWYRLKVAVERSLETGEHYQLELELIRPDGTIRWVDAFGGVTYDNHGRVTGLHGTVQDITERKRAEEALRGSEKQYRTLFEAIADTVFLIDQETGSILDVNPTATRMYGFSRDEFLQMTTTDVSAEPEKTARATSEPVPFIPLRYHQHKDGSVFPVELAASSFELRGRNTIIATARDITARMQADEKLRESEQRLRHLADNLPNAVVYQLIAEPDGGRRFTYISRAVERLNESTEEEVLADAGVLYKQVLPEYRAVVTEREEEALKNLTTMRVEVQSRLPSGRLRWFEYVSTPYHQADGLLLWDGIELDITDRKLAEKIQSDLIEKNPMSIQIMDKEGFTLQVNPAHTLLFGPAPPPDFSIFAELQNKGFDEFILLAKKGEVVNFPDIYFNVHDIYSELPDKPVWIRAVLFPLEDIDGNPERFVFMHEDITERKQAEEALRESEEKYRTLVENASDIVFRTNENGNFTFVNPAVSRITGYTAEELIGKRYTIVMRPDMCDASIKFYGRQFVKRLQNTYAEYPIITKEGHEIWFGQNTQLIVKDGHVSGFQVVARDITERKQAENALRESEDNLKSIFLAAPIGIGIVSNRIIKRVNDRLCKMLGYSREELIDQSARIFYATDEDFEFVGREKYAQISQWGTGTVETRWIRKDGVMMNVLLSSTPLDMSDLAAGVTFTALDVTERKQIEGALKQSEERYRGLFEHAIEGIYQSTPEGRFINVNPAMANMCGYESPEEMIAAITDIPTQYYAAPRDRETYKSLLDANGRIDNIEYRIRRKDGNVIWVSGSARVVRNDLGDILYYEGRTQDITERKRAEEERGRLEAQLHQAQKLESIGTLAGGIAHDFNNLLMGIQGYASLSLMNLDPSHPNYERLKRIEEQVQSGADLTKQLLGFASGGRYAVKPTDMNDIIEKTSSMFGRTKKEISIHRKYGKDLRPVEVDQGQMDQVFMNLYVNAWQAMPGGGDIYLETENVLLDDEQAFPYTVKPGKYVKITVTDTGIGMDEKTRERIFDPFFTTKEMGRGTGLGLATVYGIIKGHKGMIHVDSEPGHGTTFTIYLPASEKAIDKEKIAATEILTGTETVLLVDDEQMVLEVTRELLESLGYKVYAAASGQEAIAVYMEKRNDIDLVILDMIMPGISGGETFDRLREINSNAKVLLSSGYSINGEAQTIMDRGCNGFLQKPFHLEKLARKAREILD
jgi:two-component system cell cycle sensor histidine kinase/response regulator CckA